MGEVFIRPIEREPIEKARLERALHYFHMHKVELTQAAAEGRKESDNHRGFNVGAAVLGVKRNPTDPDNDIYIIYTAGNIKKAPGDKTPDDACAEKLAMQRAIDDGCDFIAGLATISDKVHTGETDERYHDVLHPCKLCRGQFVDGIQQNILSNDSLLFNARDRGEDNTSDRVFQVAKEMTVGDLLERYHK